MKYTKKISILGCGWVGKALKVSLEDNVCCLSRDVEANVQGDMYDCDVLVVAIPPRENYFEVLTLTLEKISEQTQVIFLSSISFYDGKELVVEGEKLVQKLHANVTVLRLGGLMGYDRIAGKYSAGKTVSANSGTNYVHRNDVVGIIETIIKNDVKGEVFDVVAPIQSTKKVIFTQNAKKFGFKQTVFGDENKVAKELSPQKLIDRLNYVFLKEDVHSFWND